MFPNLYLRLWVLKVNLFRVNIGGKKQWIKRKLKILDHVVTLLLKLFLITLFLFEVITLNELSFLDGLISHLRVGASEDNFGPYICYVNNSIGAGVPCEADVQGKFVRVKITSMILTINVQVIQEF